MKIIKRQIEFLKSYNNAVNSVCKEAKYLSNDTGFTLDSSKGFLEFNIENDNPQFFYLNDNNEVIAWCDIVPNSQDYFKHIGILGMGIVKEYRSKGIGYELLIKTLNYANEKSIEKVELEVYESNTNAISLYKKIGFEVEGVKKMGKKYKNQYEDILLMGLILNDLNV